MPLSTLFHPESVPVELDEVTSYQVFSCPQWKSPNLDLMPEAAKQRFAVMYHVPLEETFVIHTLERAYLRGALSGIKVVAAYKDNIKLFLSSEVAGSNFATIESLWLEIIDTDWNQRLMADFGNEHEVYSGRSDFVFWMAVKEILQSNTLGLEKYEVISSDDYSDDMIDDFEVF